MIPVDRLADVPTPSLVVDVPAMQRNIRRMAEHFSRGPCRLRPHFKAHATPEIARRQLAAGSCTGLTCATVAEAEAVAALADDVLIANEIVDPEKCRRAAVLARRIRVTVAVDSELGIERLNAAGAETGTTVGVLVDLNVGQNRCGVDSIDDALALGRLVAASSAHLTLLGLMGYEGHAVGIHDRAAREAAVLDAMSRLGRVRDAFAKAGLATGIVSTGGTGSYDIASTIPGVTEVQAGSYVLMDTDYARHDLPFEHAAFLLGTVISRAANRCVLDVGHKACTKDHGYPAVCGVPHAEVTALNDEHATIALPPDATVAAGDRLLLLPSHIDPTMHLHRVVYAVGDHGIEQWPRHPA